MEKIDVLDGVRELYPGLTDREISIKTGLPIDFEYGPITNTGWGKVYNYDENGRRVF